MNFVLSMALINQYLKISQKFEIFIHFLKILFVIITIITPSFEKKDYFFKLPHQTVVIPIIISGKYNLKYLKK